MKKTIPALQESNKDNFLFYKKFDAENLFKIFASLSKQEVYQVKWE